MNLPKKVRRVLSADESLQRYFQRLEADMNKRMMARWKLVRIVQKRDDNIDMVMQVLRVLDSDEGVYIEVR